MNTFVMWPVLNSTASLLKMMQSPLLGLGSVVDVGALQRLKEKEQQVGDHQALQARIIQLEGQVKIGVVMRKGNIICMCLGFIYRKES